jgi:hypothetical protein
MAAPGDDVEILDGVIQPANGRNDRPRSIPEGILLFKAEGLKS